MSKYPVGPKTIEKALNTQAGRLSVGLNKILYEADLATVMLKSHTDSNGEEQFTIKAKKFVCSDRVFNSGGASKLPRNVSPVGAGDCYFETESMLMAIRDYLEAAAIREVCE